MTVVRMHIVTKSKRISVAKATRVAKEKVVEKVVDATKAMIKEKEKGKEKILRTEKAAHQAADQMVVLHVNEAVVVIKKVFEAPTKTANIFQTRPGQHLEGDHLPRE